MKLSLIIGTYISLAVILSAVAAQPPAAESNQNIPVSQDRNAGLSAWAKIYEVVSHPRCANCHVEDGRPMWSGSHYGEAPRVHGMNIGGDPDLLLGRPGLMCTTCHMPENSPKLHGPPGNEVWHLPPKEMVWWEKSSAWICAQLQDPDRNGGRSLEEIEEHIAQDSLVAWGWSPGPGREPAPYSAQQTAGFVKTWAANGAPCPAE